MKTPEQLRELADRLEDPAECRTGPWEPAGDAADELRSIASALEAVGVEPPVAWQFRWTNPGDNPSVSPDELAWKPVETRSGQSLETCIAELEGYRYGKKPCYEVRALYGPSVALRLAEALRQRDRAIEVLTEFARGPAHQGYIQGILPKQWEGFGRDCMLEAQDALKEISDGK